MPPIRLSALPAFVHLQPLTLPHLDLEAVLPLLKWAATVLIACAIFGYSAAGALSLVSANANSADWTLKERIVPAAVRSMGPTVEIKPIPKVPPVTVVTATAPMQKAVPIAKPKMMATLGLAVRARPEKDSEQVAALQQGEIVEIGSKSGGWILVTTRSGKSGWAYGKYLTLVDPHIAETSPFWTGEN